MEAVSTLAKDRKAYVFSPSNLPDEGMKSFNRNTTILQVRHFRTKTASGWAPQKKYKVGILGATGAVGQRFVQYLEGHPWFEVTRLGASERSEGKPYEKAANWGVTANVPEFVRGMKVVSVDPKDYGNDVDLVFSALVSATNSAAPSFVGATVLTHSRLAGCTRSCRGRASLC